MSFHSDFRSSLLVATGRLLLLIVFYAGVILLVSYINPTGLPAAPTQYPVVLTR
jgi:hypothetical protein